MGRIRSRVVLDDTSNHEYTQQVNYIIELYNFCKEFRALPRAGGVQDQDSYVMHLFDAIMVYANERLDNERKKDKNLRGRR